jgi:hypothetical protein
VPLTKEAWKELVNFVVPEETELLRGQSRRREMHQP